MADPTGNIGALNITVGADYSKMSQALGQAQSQAATAGQSISSAFNGTTASANSLFTSLTDVVIAIQKVEMAIGGLSASQSNAAITGAEFQAGINGLEQTIMRESAAATLAAQRNMAMGQSFKQIGEDAAAATVKLAEFMAVAMMLRQVATRLEGLRESEMELLHLSEATGISARQFAQFQGAINRAGGDGEVFGKAIVFLSRSIEQGQKGVKGMSDELHRLGVTSQDPIEAFFQIAETLHNTKDKSEALASASRVLGRNETELIGVLGQGSAALREYLAASGELADARAKAIEDAQKLTLVENQMKEAVTEVATGALPVLAAALKVIATAFSAVNIVVKAVGQTILHTFAGAVQAGRDFGTVLSDLAHGKWDMLAIDAKEALSNIRDQFKSMTKDMEKDTSDSFEFIRKLWNTQVPQPTPGAGKAFAAPAGKADKAGEEQLKKWQELLAMLKSQMFSEDELQKAGATKREAGFFEDTVTSEREFWRSRLQIAKDGGAAWADVYRHIIETVGSLTVTASKQFSEAEKKEVEKDKKDFQDQLKEVMEKSATPHISGREFAEQTLQSPLISEGAMEGAQEALRNLTGAAKEESEAIARYVKEAEIEFAEMGNRTLAQTRAFVSNLISEISLLAGSQESVLALRKRLTELDKQEAAQTVKVSDLQQVSQLQQQEANVAVKKIALQSEYDSLVTKTFADELSFRQRMDALDTQGLRLKEKTALAEYTIALAMGTEIQQAEALNKWLKANADLSVQQAKAGASQSKLTFDESSGVQIARGLSSNIASAGQSLASSFGNAVANNGKIGLVFRDALKHVEAGAISTVMGQAIKRGMEVSGIDKLISGAMKQVFQAGPLHSAIVFLAQGIGTLVTMLAAHAVTLAANTAAMIAHLAVMLWHGVVLVASLIANTAATLANTIAVIASAIAGFFHAAGGADVTRGDIGLVGENGPELFVPKAAGSIIPADKTRQILSQLSVPKLSIALPDAPAVFSRDATGQAAGGGTSGDTIANNHNTGQVGDNHFNIYGAHNPREATRQIADFMKRQTGKYSPANS